MKETEALKEQKLHVTNREEKKLKRTRILKYEEKRKKGTKIEDK